MSISAVQIVQNRLILSSFKEAKVEGQKAGIRLHTSGAWFFKAINYAYDVQINDKTYTLNAESFNKWRKRINEKLIRKSIPLSAEINSKTIKEFFNNLFAPVPPIAHTVPKVSAHPHPSLSPDHIVNNPNNYSTQSFGNASKETKADRYARLRQKCEQEEKEKVQKQIADREKAKEDGTLYQTQAAVRTVLTEEERAQARFLLGLTSWSG